MTQGLKPLAMGAVMALMMLWMLHGQIIGGGIVLNFALLAFVGAHVLVVLVAILGAVSAARSSSKTKQLIDRLHRPSLHHVGLMLIGMSLTAAAIHLTLHGWSMI